MSSILQKLKGKRSKTKQSSAVSIQNTLSTDSSHASEFEIKSPLHLRHGGISKASSYYGQEQAPRRSSHSMERAHSAWISSHGSIDKGDCSENAQSPSGERSRRRSRRFSFPKNLSKPKIDSSYQSTVADGKNNGAVLLPADSAAAAAAAAKKQPPRIKEDHEIFAPPGSHSSPRKLKFQDAKVKKEKRKRDLRAQRLTQKQYDSPRRPLPKLSSDSPARSTASNGTPKKLSVASAKQFAMHREAERVAKAATALDNRGNEYFERGYFDKAMAAYSRALKLKRRTFHSMLEEADNLFDKDGKIDGLDGSEVDPKLLVSMATSINNIGYLRQRAGEATPDETMAAYNKSLRIKRKLLGNDSLSVGKTLNNIASVHYLKKDFKGAFPAYKEALQIMESNLGRGHPDVATVMSNMGDVCLAMKNKEESLERYRTALNIRWNCFGEKDPRTMRLLEKIARVEIGDSMPRREDTKGTHPVTDWDETELYDLDLQPISHELLLLKTQLQEDLERVDVLEKRLAIGMVKDNAEISRGIERLLEAQDGGSSNSNSVGLSVGHDSSVHERDTIRESDELIRESDELDEHAKQQLENSSSSRSSLQNAFTQGDQSNTSNLRGSFSSHSLDPSTRFLRTAMYSSQQQRPVLSSLQPNEIQETADGIKSALKLKEGINNLRSFEPPKEPKRVNRLVHATWLGEVES